MSNGTFTYSDDTYSDLYKDVYGFRPRGSYFYDATPEEKQTIWDDLCDSLERHNEEEKVEYIAAQGRFESRIEATIKTGAGDRETAIRWIKEAEDVLGDCCGEDDGLCWALGLPFGYFTVGHYNYGGKR